MANESLQTYLNDHLGGSLLGSDLADQIRERSEGTPLGEVMAKIAPQIAEDREALKGLMDELDVSESKVKEAGAWIAEKASRLKLGGSSSEEVDIDLFMALETLMIGVRGKLLLWKALKEVEGDYPPLAAAGLDDLIVRAQSQFEALEGERLAAGRLVLADS
jgi:hypothetical protein